MSATTCVTMAVVRCVILVAYCVLLPMAYSARSDISYCKTQVTKITVSKEKTYEYNGHKVSLLCTGNIVMTKCEGLCTSRVSPSVIAYPGFKKECKCCRESRLEDRLVSLSECYDGRSLVPGQFMHMRIREPASCQCYDCAI